MSGRAWVDKSRGASRLEPRCEERGGEQRTPGRVQDSILPQGGPAKRAVSHQLGLVGSELSSGEGNQVVCMG